MYVCMYVCMYACMYDSWWCESQDGAGCSLRVGTGVRAEREGGKERYLPS